MKQSWKQSRLTLQNDLPLEIEQQIDDVCVRFEKQWQNDHEVDLQTFCEEIEPPLLQQWGIPLLVELIHLDMEYRWFQDKQSAMNDSIHRASENNQDEVTQRVRPLFLEDYLGKHSHLLTINSLPRELVEQEFRLRLNSDSPAEIEEYLKRFPAIVGLEKSLKSIRTKAIGDTSQNRSATKTSAKGRSETGRSETGDSDLHSKPLDVRCPECFAAIAVQSEASFSEISCTSCGSCFSLVGDETTSTGSDHPLKLGQFLLLEKIGTGGFGTVWRAHDTKLDRIVAIKIPRKGQLSTAEAEQFFREARAAAQLSHPYIVSVHEVGRQLSTIYIVSDYVQGDLLTTKIDNRDYDLNQASLLCEKLALALHHAHQQGVVHRDLKPANIILDEHGDPHIMDFGLAKRDLGEVTMTVEGKILGTPAYMSPEQAKGEGHHADRRSDIYSLGVILFELMTGELPFRGNTASLVPQILQDQPPQPRKLNRRIPRDLETICLRCLEKTPHTRYQTSLEVAEELNRFLKHQPILARPISNLERLSRWYRNRPLIAGLSTALTLLILAIAIVAPIVAFQQSRLKNEATDNSLKLSNSLKKQRQAFHKVNALRLSAEAKAIVKDFPQRSLLLAIKAIELTQDENQTPLPATHQALRDILSQVHGYGMSGHQAKVTAIALSERENSSKSRWLISGSSSGEVCFWNCSPLSENKQLSESKEPIRHQLSVGTIQDIQISSDNRWAIVATSSGVMLLWDLVKEKTLRPVKLLGHESSVQKVAIDKNSRWLVSGDIDGNVFFWDLLAEQPEKSRKILTSLSSRIRVLKFSPGGKYLAIADNSGQFQLLNSASINPKFDRDLPTIIQSGEGAIHAIAFNQKEDLLVTVGADHLLHLWEMKEGTLTPQKIATLTGHQGAVRGIAIHPRLPIIASAGADRVIRLWQLNTKDYSLKASKSVSGHKKIVRQIKFSQDGHSLLSVSEDKTVRVWNIEHSIENITSRILRGHEATVSCLAISNDGQQLFTGSYDQTIRSWNLTKASSAASPISFSIAKSKMPLIAISSDGRWIVSKSDENNLKIYKTSSDVKSIQLFQTIENTPNQLSCLTFHPKLQQFVSANKMGNVTFWKLNKDQKWSKGHAWQLGDGEISEIHLSRTADALLLAGNDSNSKGWLKLFRLSDKDSKPKLSQELSMERHLVNAALTADGKYIAASLILAKSQSPIKQIEQHLKLWRVSGDSEWTPILPTDKQPTLSPILSLSFSDDSRQLITGSYRGLISIYSLKDITKLEAKRQFLTQQGSVHQILKLSEKNESAQNKIITADQDKALRVWDLNSTHPGYQPLKLAGLDKITRALQVTKNSRWLISATDDGTIRYWPLEMDQLIQHARNVAGREISSEEYSKYFLQE